MSVEERLDLIGKKLIENDNLSSEEGVVTGGGVILLKILNEKL